MIRTPSATHEKRRHQRSHRAAIVSTAEPGKESICLAGQSREFPANTNELDQNPSSSEPSRRAGRAFGASQSRFWPVRHAKQLQKKSLITLADQGRRRRGQGSARRYGDRSAGRRRRAICGASVSEEDRDRESTADFRPTKVESMSFRGSAGGVRARTRHGAPHAALRLSETRPMR
jgi:hypothetical protein